MCIAWGRWCIVHGWVQGSTYQELWRVSYLSYLQSSNLACYSVTDADRRHETPGSETKTLLVRAEQAAWVSCLCRFFLALEGDMRQSCGCWMCSGFVSQLRNHKFRKLQFFIMGCKQTSSNLVLEGDINLYYTRQWTALEGDTVSVLQGCPLHSHPWTDVQNKICTHRTWRSMRDQWRIVSQILVSILNHTC